MTQKGNLRLCEVMDINMIKRNTVQRSIVLDTVCRLRCHATADDIYREIHGEHPTISRATVYRNLKELSDSGEIRRLEIPGSADCYDHICKNHCHVKCDVCGRVFDVDMDFVNGLENEIRDTHGFDFTGYDIIFHGICPSCKQ